MRDVNVGLAINHLSLSHSVKHTRAKVTLSKLWISKNEKLTGVDVVVDVVDVGEEYVIVSNFFTGKYR